MSVEHENDPHAGDGFVWQTTGGESDDDERGKDGLRRRAGRLAVVAAVLLAALASLVLVPGSSFAHTTFTANDVVVTGNSGQLQELTIAPSGDIHYDGLESVPSSVTVTVEAKLAADSAWETVGSTSLSVSDLQGTANYSFASIDLLSSTSMVKSDFRATDGSTSSTDVDVRVTATLVGAGPAGSDVTTTSLDTMTVSVTNEPAGANAGGSANSGGNAR